MRATLVLGLVLLSAASAFATGSYVHDDFLPRSVFPMGTSDNYRFDVQEGQVVRATLTWDPAEGDLYLRLSEQADGQNGCDLDDEPDCYTRLLSDSCKNFYVGSLVAPAPGRLDVEWTTEVSGRGYVMPHVASSMGGVSYRIEISVDGEAPEPTVFQEGGISVVTVAPGLPGWPDAVCLVAG